MKLKEIINIITSTNGSELFEQVKGILAGLGICVYDEDGNVKDLYDLCCDIADVFEE